MQQRAVRRFALCLTLALGACSPSAGTGGGGEPSSSGGSPGSSASGGAPGAAGATGSSGAGTSTGGSSAAGGSGGASNNPDPIPDAESTPPASDAGAPPSSTDTASTDDAPPATPPPAPGGKEDPKAFNCTLVIGIAATGQWFNAGFEKLVDNARWELLAVHSGFVNTWADPNSAFWNMNPSSACAANPKNPDRVILVALYLHWMDATVDEWVKVRTATANNFKTKYTNLKRLELATFVRAPDDKPCAGSMPFKSWIKPEQDQAYDKIAAMFPDFVTVSPKFQVANCSAFGGNPPHFGGNNASVVAKMIADHYNGVTTAAP